MLTRRRSRTDSTLSATGQYSTETLKNNCMAFFVLLRCFDADIQPAPTNRNPIAPPASAANASGSVQTTLSKLPRPPDLHIPAFCFGAVPIGTYRLSWLIVVCFSRFWVRDLPFPNARRLGHPFQWKNTLPWHLGPAVKVRILRFKDLPPFRHDAGLQNHV